MQEIYGYCERTGLLEKLEWLKLHIMCKGIRIDDRARGKIIKDLGRLSLFEYATTSGLALKLEGGIFVNANFAEHYCRDSDLELFLRNGDFILGSCEGEWRVEIMPHPGYLNMRSSAGNPITDLVMTHNDRVRISPVQGCANRCKFCDLGYRKRYRVFPYEELLEAAEMALRDKRLQPRHVLVSGGHPHTSDISMLDDIYIRLARAISQPMDIMMLPRKDCSVLEGLKEAGVDGLAVNLEIYDRRRAKSLMPQKAELGLETYCSFLSRAVELFGRGKVRSLIILGLEDYETAIKGVELIASLGADPVLSLFKPAVYTPLERWDPPSEEAVIYIYEASKEIARRYEVALGPRCVPCQHNAVSFPYSEDYYEWSKC